MLQISQASKCLKIVWIIILATVRVLSFSEPYVWNDTAISAEDFLSGYGKTYCNSVVVHTCLTNMDAFPCNCDPDCATYGTCCTDRVGDKMTPAWPETGCLEDGAYAMVRCPQSWGQGDIREACETGQGKYTVDEPVTNLSSKVTYRNAFCAQCHGVDTYTKWELSVTCNHFQFIFGAVSHEQFLDMAERDAEVCSITAAPPREVFRGSCPGGNWFSAAVDTCNVTGDWAADEYDADVEKNCILHKGLVLRVSYLGLTFQNLFCAICNGVGPNVTSSCKDDGPGLGTIGFGLTPVEPVQPPLSLLLGLQDESDTSEAVDYTESCTSYQWLDHSNECRNLTCAPGKVIVNGTCSTAVTQIRGLIYSLDLTLAPTTETVITAEDMKKINSTQYNTQLAQLIQRTVSEKLSTTTRFYVILEFIFQELSCSPTTFKLYQAKISGAFRASRDTGRDEAEQSLLDDLFFAGWNVTLGATDVTLRYAPERDLPFTAGSNISFKSIKAEFGKYDMFDTTWDDISPELYIPFSPHLLCAFLELNASEFEIRSDKDNVTQLVLMFGDREVALSELDLVRMEEGQLKVCLETLESLPRERKTEAGSASWQYILSMVAFPLSILCLLLTLIVYSLLPKLRTQPGLNTMGTCCALLVAQVTLLLASHRVTSGDGCVVLGMVVHLAWLSMFCWTTVCSTHMFHVFSAKTYRGSDSSRYWKLARNIIVTILLPAVGVGLVVGVSYQTSDGASIGYSDVSCYLESALLVGVAMVLPVSLIMVLNLVLFTLTVRRIHQVTKLQARAESEGESRQHVNVCARLSMLTGGTWVLSLVAEGADIDWLRAVAIVTNGGQGVLMFLSYVATRRVAVMLAVKLGLREALVTSGTQATSVSEKVSKSVSTKYQA